MRVVASERFKRAYRRLPEQVRELTDRKLLLLEQNPGHPSLRVKKLAGAAGIWEASITMRYRMTFELHRGCIVLRVIAEHDEALRQP
jgi:mRNA interferase RelE/StbE